MSIQVQLTQEQKNKLRQAMKKGGIFLRLVVDQPDKVHVQATDGDEGCIIIDMFDKEMSLKINCLYNNQKEYKAPLENGTRLVSISWFIAAYC